LRETVISASVHILLVNSNFSNALVNRYIQLGSSISSS